MKKGLLILLCFIININFVNAEKIYAEKDVIPNDYYHIDEDTIVLDAKTKQPVTGLLIMEREHWIPNKIELPLKNGKMDGIKKQYVDNILDEEVQYKNGKRTGVQRNYYKNGKLSGEFLNGLDKYYDENGVLYMEEYKTWNGNKEKTLFYYPNGNLKEETHFETSFGRLYIHPKKHGEAKTYYENGHVKSELYFNKGIIEKGFMYGADGKKQKLTDDEIAKLNKEEKDNAAGMK
ncbi:MAG: hypothetical protein LBR70_02755 [Lactobacillaceae bacterium]|jgi:antitoxin component YwqK of YwqJK toxin-antitoxin module|nr:hypothetical protein [Lactobacillaceae bacterium]